MIETIQLQNPGQPTPVEALGVARAVIEHARGDNPFEKDVVVKSNEHVNYSLVGEDISPRPLPVAVIQGGGHDYARTNFGAKIHVGQRPISAAFISDKDGVTEIQTLSYDDNQLGNYDDVNNPTTHNDLEIVRKQTGTGSTKQVNYMHLPEEDEIINTSDSTTETNPVVFVDRGDDTVVGKLTGSRAKRAVEILDNRAARKVVDASKEFFARPEENSGKVA